MEKLPRTLAALLVIAAVAAVAQEAPSDNGAAEKREGIIAGTVFQESGMSLAGAQITVTADDAEHDAKPLTGTSDRRGEFAFRVPAGTVGYDVSVAAKGFAQATKHVESVGWDQRVSLFFRLKPEAKN